MLFGICPYSSNLTEVTSVNKPYYLAYIPIMVTLMKLPQLTNHIIWYISLSWQLQLSSLTAAHFPWGGFPEPQEDPMAVSMNWGPFCGCPYNKSPTILGWLSIILKILSTLILCNAITIALMVAVPCYYWGLKGS